MIGYGEFKPGWKRKSDAKRLLSYDKATLVAYILEVWRNYFGFGSRERFDALDILDASLELGKSEVALRRAMQRVNLAAQDESPNGRLDFWKANDACSRALSLYEKAISRRFPAAKDEVQP